jgi:hypothetical protein
MITHGTPPVAEGGWYEFIKDFGIGFLPPRRFTPAGFSICSGRKNKSESQKHHC